MSYLGQVGLSDKVDGLYIGRVNLSIDVSNNALLYAPNGYNISGLNLGDGLNISGTNLKTIGNPEIQLTSNSIYVNDNISSIQTAVNNASQAKTIFISSGSYGESLAITNKYNISLINPSCNNGTICEILNGLTINGTSELIRLSNLQIKGENTVIAGVGRHRLNNILFTGSVLTPLNINIGQSSTKFMTFLDCEFDVNCNVTINATFANVIYFINCNFGNATINCNQFASQQVIFNNCSGLDNLIGNNYTKAGITNTGTDINLNINNGYIAPNGTLNLGLQSKIILDEDDGGVNNVLTSNGASGLTWTPVGGYNSYWNVLYENGQQTVKSPADSIILYQKLEQYNILPNLRMLFKCIFNFSISNSNPNLTLSLVRIQEATETTLQSFVQSLSRSGHHSFPVNFDFVMDGDYSLSFKIVASVSAGNISTDAVDYFSVIVDEIQPVQ